MSECPSPHSHFTGGGGTTQAGRPGGLLVPVGRVGLHELPDELQPVSEFPAVLPDESRKLLVTRPPDGALAPAEPVKRPLESLNSVFELPLDPHRLEAVPVSRPLASRYSVRVWSPEPLRVVAVPSNLPEASRIVAREVSPEPSRCSTV